MKPGLAETCTPSIAEASPTAETDVVWIDAETPTTAAEPLPGRTADYALNGLVEYNAEGTATASFRLRDVAEGVEVWSRTYDRVAAGPARLAEEDRVVVDLASSLLQPFGVIQARERAKNLTAPRGDPRYRCVLLALDAIRSREAAQHDAARACLEQLTAADRSFAAGLAYLAAIYDAEYVFGSGRDGADPRALDNALIVARRGIERSGERTRLSDAGGRSVRTEGDESGHRGDGARGRAEPV
jgi:hypothetical protein